jgi:hypothetical protein
MNSSRLSSNYSNNSHLFIADSDIKAVLNLSPLYEFNSDGAIFSIPRGQIITPPAYFVAIPLNTSNPYIYYSSLKSCCDS